MIDSIYGIPTVDIGKIRRIMNTYMIEDVDTLLLCFDEDKIKKINRKKLIEQRDKINMILKEEE